MSLKKIIALTFSIVLILVCTYGFVSHSLKAKSSAGFAVLIEKTLPKIVLGANLNGAFRETRIQIRSVAFEGISQKEADEFAANALQQVGLVQGYLEEIKQLEKNPEEQRLADELFKAWPVFLDVGVQIVTNLKGGVETNKDKILRLVLVSCPAAAKPVQESIDNIIRYQLDRAAQEKATANQLVNQNNLAILVATAVIALVCCILGFFLFNYISSRVNRIRKTLADTASTLINVSESVSEQAGNLSQSTVSQSASTDQTMTAVDEISAMIARTAQETVSSLEESKAGRQRVDVGLQENKKLEIVLRQQDELFQTFLGALKDSEEEMVQLAQMVKQIEEKTNVINDIVFQTKLLSFNASVESARAGEAGKGFAVVADEVGNLAKMSGSASQEIAKLIEKSSSKSKSVIEASKERSQKCRQSIESVSELLRSASKGSAESFLKISEDFDNLRDRLKHIASANKEQEIGMIEVSKAMTRLQQETQVISESSATNLAMAQKVIHQSEEVGQQSSSLNAIIEGASGNISKKAA